MGLADWLAGWLVRSVQIIHVVAESEQIFANFKCNKHTHAHSQTHKWKNTYVDVVVHHQLLLGLFRQRDLSVNVRDYLFDLVLDVLLPDFTATTC